MSAELRSWLRIASSRRVIGIGLRTSLVVGTLLNAINHGPALAADWHAVSALALVLNFVVPYCVASYGATSFAMREARAGSASSE